MDVLYKKQKLGEASSKNSGRQFQNWWTEMYGVIEKSDKAICVICSVSVVSRTSSVKRHYETIHKELLGKSRDEQKEYILRAIKNKNLQSSALNKFVNSNSNYVAASFEIAKIIAKNGKPLSDGDYIKNAFLECAPFLFEDFGNKEKIFERIKELPIARNTIKDRILKMGKNVTYQQKTDIKLCDWISICLDESTDVTLSARLAIFVRYFAGNKIMEELISLVSLPETTKGTDICKAVVEALSRAEINLSKIVSVSTDGAPSMIGQTAGFVNLFTQFVGHPLLAFHCIIHQEALCAKDGLKSFEDVMKLVTKIVNYIAAHPLCKRKFESLLNEVNSMYNGLTMYNNVRWLSRGKVLQRFVECFDEIYMFLSNQKIIQYEELSDVEWISRLMFFTDFCSHLNDLNIKLQGRGKIITVMFDNIKAFEAKLQIFKRDIMTRNFKYFPNLKKYMMDLEIHEKPDVGKLLESFENALNATIEQFPRRFVQFRQLEETTKFITHPDTYKYQQLNLTMFEYMELDDFEMELVDFQSSSIWTQKFKDLRIVLEEIERDRFVGPVQRNAENEVLTTWQSIPETFSCLKKIATGILTMFSSTYSCESLFSSMNFIKSDIRSRLTDESTTACILLKATSYEPDIKYLASSIQQQKSH